ncbi:MAG: hypothetical protein ACLQGP_15365 [Isosphaeraceae bacterium]
MTAELDPLLADEGNAYGPLGNDTGADVRALYLRWRQAGKLRRRFLPHLLQEWEIGDRDWDDLDPERVEGQLAESAYQRLVRDDLIIGLAFAQYLVDDQVEAEVKRRALVAIERQGLDCVLGFRDWTDRGERARNLEAMRRFLTSETA